jgi:hypothetical protein
LLGWDASGAEFGSEWTTVHTMMDRIESAGTCTTIIMAGFTIMMAVCSVFIITFHKTSEDITKSSTAKIANITVTIIIAGATNIWNTPGHPQDRKIGGNET